MYWKVTHIDASGVEGWAYDGSRPEKNLEIIVLQGDNIIGRGAADLPMPDGASGAHEKKNCAFSIKLKGVHTVTDIKVVCLGAAQHGEALILHSANKNEIGTYMLPYQGGSSDSDKKLAALGVSSFKNKRVLDLGCNEGFFCLKAHWGGARRVLGLDSSEWFIEKAKGKIYEYDRLAADGALEFRHASWWELPEEKFDVILFLSAIHYEKEQKKLLDLLATRLSKQGVLILECGAVTDDNLGRQWVNIRRANDLVRFPTHDYLLETLLDKYAVRVMGRSVPQKGDPIPRMIYHCTLRKPTAGIIRGTSKSGKSMLARLLQNKNVNVIKSDSFFAAYIKGGALREFAPKTPFYAMLADEIDSLSMQKIPQRMRELDAVDEFCNDFISTLPADEALTIIEGEVFSHDFVFERFVYFLKKNNMIVWDITRV